MEIESNLFNAYIEAYRKACGEFIKLDAAVICSNSNCQYRSTDNSIEVMYLNAAYIVNCNDGAIYREDGGEVPMTEKVLILHYLIKSQYKQPTNGLISFNELHGVNMYYQNFEKRAIKPLVKTFSNNSDGLYKAAKVLGGEIVKYGDAGITIKLFPLVPITYIIWQGDEEFSPSGTILFDSSIQNYLPDEDIIIAASFGVYALIRNK